MKLSNQLGIGAFGLFVMSLTGCGEVPQSRVEDFYLAVDKGEITKAQGYLASDVDSVPSGGGNSASLAEQHKRALECGGVRSVDVDLGGERDFLFGKATVSYRGECPDSTDDVELVRGPDDWKLVIK